MLIATCPLYAQMDNVVEVENNYRPTVKDANKINKLPEIEEHQPQHYNVEYSTNALSTNNYAYQPIDATQSKNLIGNEKKNFASLGYGTEGNILGRLALQTKINNSLSSNIEYSTRGHQGYIKRFYDNNETWKSRYYSNNLRLDLSQKLNKQSTLTFGIGGTIDLFNYQPSNYINDYNTDKQHNNRFNIDAELSPYKFGDFQIGAEAKLVLFNQKYKTNLNDKYKETLFKLELCPEYELSKNLKIEMELGFDHADYCMDEVKGYNAFEIVPNIVWENKKFEISLGAYFNSENKIAPNVDVTYHAKKNLEFYLEAKGGEIQQNFSTFSLMSPYWILNKEHSEEIEIENEFDQLRLKAGLRINPINGLYADINAGYDIQENRAELANNLTNTNLCYNPIVFVEGRHFYANADINYKWKDYLTVNLFNQYNKWTNKDKIDFTWRPIFNMNWSATARVIDNLKLGVDFVFQNFESSKYSYKRPDTCDLGASISYTFPMGLSLYAKGNNLLNKNYDQFLGYKTSGANVLFGAAITF